MYLARFSYTITPVDRDRAVHLLQQEVTAAREQGLEARLLVPLTRPPGGAALQYEVVLPNLDRFETFRDQGMGGEEETRSWLRELSQIMPEPPSVELLRIADDAVSNQQASADTEGRKLLGGHSQHA